MFVNKTFWKHPENIPTLAKLLPKTSIDVETEKILDDCGCLFDELETRMSWSTAQTSLGGKSLTN
jgi:hypothetical protein